jgi:hypothetical protein
MLWSSQALSQRLPLGCVLHRALRLHRRLWPSQALGQSLLLGCALHRALRPSLYIWAPLRWRLLGLFHLSRPVSHRFFAWRLGQTLALSMR